MREATGIDFNRQVYLRLIALWVVCEAFAGGILHGFKIPFTGLGVGSLAIFCIVLIGWYVPEKGAILKATVIVAVFKMMLSPHAPPTAYIALFFQGAMGQLLLRKKHFTTGAILLGVLALTESAIQRILVLVIIYGETFWKAVDAYVMKLFSSRPDSFTLKLALVYIFIHAVTGFIIGRYASKLVRKAGEWRNEPVFILPADYDEKVVKPKRKRKINRTLLVTWIIFLFLYFQQFIENGIFILPANSALNVVLRSAVIILTWVTVISPLLMSWLRKKLDSGRNRYETEVLSIIRLLPQVKYIVKESWRRSRIEGKRKWKLFGKYLVVNILYG